jgi:hypothetical protein
MKCDQAKYEKYEPIQQREKRLWLREWAVHEALYGIPYGDSTAPREYLGKGVQRALTAYFAASHSQPERKQEDGDMALCCREVWGKGEAREYWYCNVLTGTSTQRDSHKC